ncbi:MAG: hypothetical protein L0H79_19665, partial [Intrasporangium sp.]|nr:hypothetical protein [Intrasporangium sp.]
APPPRPPQHARRPRHASDGPVCARRVARPLVLLRGDMDALPVTEETGLPYSSEVPGRNARLRA